MSSLAEINIGINQTQKALEDLDSTYKQSRERLTDQKKNLERLKAVALKDFNLDKVLLAERIIKIRHTYTHHMTGKKFSVFGGGDTEATLKEAITEFSENQGKRFFHNYIGCKDYDRWTCQGNGFCPYGCGPRHGAIVFSIGLIGGHRDDKDDLTAEQLEAIIYYLENRCFLVVAPTVP